MKKIDHCPLENKNIRQGLKINKWEEAWWCHFNKLSPELSTTFSTCFCFDFYSLNQKSRQNFENDCFENFNECFGISLFPFFIKFVKIDWQCPCYQYKYEVGDYRNSANEIHGNFEIL